MTRVIGFWIASLAFGPLAVWPAEGVPEKRLFVVRVEALKPIVQDGKQTVAAKKEGKAEESVTEFTLETSTTAEVWVESRAQQIQAMNGAPLMRIAPGGGAPRARSGVAKTLDLLLPRGKPLLSKNPNARRDPLRILEE
jgi:hypothetical protein